MEAKKVTTRKPRKPKLTTPEEVLNRIINRIILTYNEEGQAISGEVTFDLTDTFIVEQRYFNGDVDITEYDKTIFNEAMFINKLKTIKKQ